MRPPRPWPSCRRARSRSMSAGLSSSPAGSPSTIAVSPGPCDSPAVTKRRDMAPTPYWRVAGPSGDECLAEGLVARAGSRVLVRRAGVEGVDRLAALEYEWRTPGAEGFVQ